MRAVVQRVTEARVTVDGKVVGEIGNGLLVFVGIGKGDDSRKVAYLANKLVGLRIFRDAEGRFDCSVEQVGGAVLLVSQFTLYGDCRRGLRPSFDQAAAAEEAEEVYEALAEALRERGVPVMTGRFQRDMVVASLNDGPVTLLLDGERGF